MADQPETKNVDSPDNASSKTKKSNLNLTNAQRDQIRDLFEDVYVTNKWRVVRVNLLRGLAFGFGTFIGGTIVVAILVWVLSQTVDIFPPIRDFVERLTESLAK